MPGTLLTAATRCAVAVSRAGSGIVTIPPRSLEGECALEDRSTNRAGGAMIFRVIRIPVNRMN